MLELIFPCIFLESDRYFAKDSRILSLSSKSHISPKKAEKSAMRNKLRQSGIPGCDVSFLFSYAELTYLSERQFSQPSYFPNCHEPKSLVF